MRERLKICAGPLKFFDPPNLRGQTEASRSNQFHGLSLRISTYKKSAGAHVMNRWRRSGNVVERSETVAQVAPAMILGQRDLRLLSCKSAYVAAFASPLEYALTQKGGRGYPPRTSSASGHSRSNEVGGEEQLRPKADPSAKISASG
jgi:hypothetical protein